MDIKINPRKHNIKLEIYLRTLKTHYTDIFFYFTNPENVSEINVIAYHSLNILKCVLENS